MEATGSMKLVAAVSRKSKMPRPPIRTQSSIPKLKALNALNRNKGTSTIIHAERRERRKRFCTKLTDTSAMEIVLVRAATSKRKKNIDDHS